MGQDTTGSLAGKTALITGAAHHIGAGIARLLVLSQAQLAPDGLTPTTRGDPKRTRKVLMWTAFVLMAGLLLYLFFTAFSTIDQRGL